VPGQQQRPGRELPREFREIVTDLVVNQGWRYQFRPGGRHPKLYPADRTQPMLSVPTTPSDNRALRNFIAAVRQRGGVWPREA
jgi:hypothetical protein